MKLCKIFSSIVILIIVLLTNYKPTLAQELVNVYDPSYLTTINSSEFSEVNSPTIFAAEAQFDTSKIDNLQFDWSFGDYNYDQGDEVAHAFNKAGKYEVTLTTKSGNEILYKSTKEIIIPIKAGILITDKTSEINKIKTIINSAENSDVYLKMIDSFNSQSVFLSEEILTKKISKYENEISKVDTIISWTEASSGLNALIRYKQNNQKNNIFKNTSIIVIDNNLSNIQRIKRQYAQLGAKEIIVVQEAGLLQFINTPNLNKFKDSLQSGGFEYEIINNEKILTIFSVEIFLIFFA